jgi:hypothetical protein
MSRLDLVTVGVGLGLVALAALLVGGRKAAEIAGTKLNPASDQNIIYEDVINRLGRNVSGDESWSLGAWIWEKTHPAQVEREREALGQAGEPDPWGEWNPN